MGDVQQMSICAVRGSRLVANGTPDYGNASGSFCAEGVGTLTYSFDVVTGTDVAELDGCGQLAVVRKYPDRLRRVNITALEFLTQNPRIPELFTESTGITAFGDVIGYITSADMNCTGAAAKNGIVLEAWSEQFQCADFHPDWPYVRTVFPKVFLRLSGKTLSNGAIRLRMEGFGQPNSNIGDGPAQDFPSDLASATNWVHAEFNDDDLPDCGASDDVGTHDYIAMSALSS
jgi:hypothetical protein